MTRQRIVMRLLAAFGMFLSSITAHAQASQPNIDRVAREGMIFTDYYAEQSCTAGRASFITGQSGLRTGLTERAITSSSATPGQRSKRDCRARDGRA